MDFYHFSGRREQQRRRFRVSSFQFPIFCGNVSCTGSFCHQCSRDNQKLESVQATKKAIALAMANPLPVPL